MNILAISLFILFIMNTYSVAQMGHGMMRHMDSMMEHKEMVSNEQMEKGLTDVIGQLSEMMSDLSIKIRSTPPDQKYVLKNIMKDISREMNAVSQIMEKGSMTDEELQAIQNGLRGIRKNISEINKVKADQIKEGR